MVIPEPSPGGDSSLAPGSFSLVAGTDDEFAPSSEPRGLGARVDGGGGERKKSRGSDVDPAAKKEKRRTKKRRAAPPAPQQHWAASLVAGGPLPAVLLGLGFAMATVTVARAVATTQGKRRKKSGELNKAGSFDGLRAAREKPDPVWKDEPLASSLPSSSSPLRRALSRTFSSSSSASSSFTLPEVAENEQTLLDISLRGTSVRQLWRLAMSSDGRLQRKFMESRGNEGVEAESDGSGWRVSEEEVVEGEEEEKGLNSIKNNNSRRSRRRKRVEIRTRVLSYITPIGGGGGGGGSSRSGSQSGGAGEENDNEKTFSSSSQYRFRKTTPCRETWHCYQRSDTGFLAAAVVRTPRVPFGERFHTELTWAAVREDSSCSSTSTSPSTTRLRITGRVVFERAIPVPGLKAVLTRAVSEGLRESYGEYRRLLLDEVGDTTEVVEEEKKNKLRKEGSKGVCGGGVNSTSLFLFVLLLLAALFLFFRAAVPLLIMEQHSKEMGEHFASVFASVERWLRRSVSLLERAREFTSW